LILFCLFLKNLFRFLNTLIKNYNATKEYI
jgi:hypothetical protein